MPKIIINEYDNTKAGVSSYENFTVLIPGLVASGKTTEFDENGVLEINSVDEFIEKIGKVSVNTTDEDTLVEPGVSPTTVTKITGDETARGFAYYNAKDREPALNVYTRTEITAEGEQIPGKLVAFDSSVEKWYRYSPAGGIDTTAVAFNKDLDYFTIQVGDEGQDSTTGEPNSHYGNQMAYMLLTLGYKVLYKKIKQIGDEETKTIPQILSDPGFWAGLDDKSLYDFRYIVTGLLNNNAEANEQIAALATFKNQKDVPPAGLGKTGRGDCIALLDVPASVYTDEAAPKTQADAISGISSYVTETAIIADKFSAFFAPFVIYGGLANDEEYGDNKTFPASLHYLVCAINAFDNLNFKEWFAVAGFNRGVGAIEITSTGCKFGENATNILQPRQAGIEGSPKRAVNLIIKNKTGYYIWGNRTAHILQNDGLIASDFLNIRQLCTTLKKQIYIACHKFTFDPNSDILWINFVDAIEPTLKDMKANQGISDYKFIKVKTNQKGVLRAKIRIVPIEAVEDFHISLFLEESVSGTTVEIEE